MTGPAVTVSLDDAPRRPGRPALSDDPDDLVVHQEDVQAVVNALWAGGAEAMTLMGERVVSTSAVRCVGNTVVLHGRVYSPPFVVTAVGDPAALRDALSVDPGVAYFQSFVDRFGLGYAVRTERSARAAGVRRSARAAERRPARMSGARRRRAHAAARARADAHHPRRGACCCSASTS